MHLKYSIAREDDYRKEVIEYYNSILNGRLMNLNLKSAKDSDLMSFITLYDENEHYYNNCCTWLDIDEIGSSNYNGRDFQYIKLLTKGGESIQINFSQFRYEMSTNPDQKGFTTFNPERAVHVCSIDGQMIEPSSFFFNQTKLCFKFAFEKIAPVNLRKYIHDVQMTVLQKCISYPAAEAPYTSLKVEVEGTVNSRPTYQHSVKCELTDNFAINIFESDYKVLFLKKLKEIETQ